MAVAPDQKLRLRVVYAIARAVLWFLDPERHEREKHRPATALLDQAWALLLEYFPRPLEGNLEVMTHVLNAVIITVAFVPATAARVLRNFAAC